MILNICPRLYNQLRLIHFFTRCCVFQSWFRRFVVRKQYGCELNLRLRELKENRLKERIRILEDKKKKEKAVFKIETTDNDGHNKDDGDYVEKDDGDHEEYDDSRSEDDDDRSEDGGDRGKEDSNHNKDDVDFIKDNADHNEDIRGHNKNVSSINIAGTNQVQVSDELYLENEQSRATFSSSEISIVQVNSEVDSGHRNSKIDSHTSISEKDLATDNVMNCEEQLPFTASPNVHQTFTKPNVSKSCIMKSFDGELTSDAVSSKSDFSTSTISTTTITSESESSFVTAGKDMASSCLDTVYGDTSVTSDVITAAHRDSYLQSEGDDSLTLKLIKEDINILEKSVVLRESTNCESSPPNANKNHTTSCLNHTLSKNLRNAIEDDIAALQKSVVLNAAISIDASFECANRCSIKKESKTIYPFSDALACKQSSDKTVSANLLDTKNADKFSIAKSTQEILKAKPLESSMPSTPNFDSNESVTADDTDGAVNKSLPLSTNVKVHGAAVNDGTTVSTSSPRGNISSVEDVENSSLSLNPEDHGLSNLQKDILLNSASIIDSNTCIPGEDPAKSLKAIGIEDTCNSNALKNIAVTSSLTSQEINEVVKTPETNAASIFNFSPRSLKSASIQAHKEKDDILVVSSNERQTVKSVKICEKEIPSMLPKEISPGSVSSEKCQVNSKESNAALSVSYDSEANFPAPSSISHNITAPPESKVGFCQAPGVAAVGKSAGFEKTLLQPFKPTSESLATVTVSSNSEIDLIGHPEQSLLYKVHENHDENDSEQDVRSHSKQLTEGLSSPIPTKRGYSFGSQCSSLWKAWKEKCMSWKVDRMVNAKSKTPLKRTIRKSSAAKKLPPFSVEEIVKGMY